MADQLKKYRSMRRFQETPEPSGGKPGRKALPIFVIQKHRASHLHYDFRLEMEGVLKSWAVPKGPSYDPSVKRLAMMTEDHPYDYASFEGVIPEGNYGAGNVIIWDQGTWDFVEPGDDPVAALRSGKLTFRLEGPKMFGEWALVRIHGRSPKGNEWLLLKHRDKYANDEIEVTAVAPHSVVSGLLVDAVSGDKVWQSNRKATEKRPPTVATALSARRPRKASAGNPAAARSKSQAGPRERSSVKSASRLTVQPSSQPKKTKAAGAQAKSTTRSAPGKTSSETAKRAVRPSKVATPRKSRSAGVAKGGATSAKRTSRRG